jgi:hypothetical protein
VSAGGPNNNIVIFPETPAPAPVAAEELAGRLVDLAEMVQERARRGVDPEVAELIRRNVEILELLLGLRE